MNNPNARIEAMAAAAYFVWHEALDAPPWDSASWMVRQKFYRIVGAMLDAAQTSARMGTK